MKTLGTMIAMYYGFENVYLFDVDLANKMMKLVLDIQAWWRKRWRSSSLHKRMVVGQKKWQQEVDKVVPPMKGCVH